MKTTIETKLIIFSNEYRRSLKLWYSDTTTFKHKVVTDCEDSFEEFCKEFVSREHKYHVSYSEDDWTCGDFHIECNCFETAYELFKQVAKDKHIESLMVCDDFNRYNPDRFNDFEEYEDDLDPDPYYTRSATYGDYSPSSPWNAPGMSVHDFI